MAMKIEAARLMVYTAAARAERGESGLGFTSSASKCFASDVAVKVTTNAVQLRRRGNRRGACESTRAEPPFCDSR